MLEVVVCIRRRIAEDIGAAVVGSYEREIVTERLWWLPSGSLDWPSSPLDEEFDDRDMVWQETSNFL